MSKESIPRAAVLACLERYKYFSYFIQIFISTSLLSQPRVIAKQLVKELFGVEELKNSNFSRRSGEEI